jgi:hypothetical protein
MINNDEKIQLSPKIVLQGGIVEATLPFSIDPFNYNQNDFCIDKNPIKMISLSNNTFIGEIVVPLLLEKHSVVYNKHGKTLLEQEIYSPQVSSTGFYEIETNPQKAWDDKVFLLDTKTLSHQSGKTIIYLSDSTFTYIEKWANFKLPFNSLVVTDKNEIFITSFISNNLFQIKENKELEVVAQGLGVPHGLATIKDNIFIADKTGNLFSFDKQTNKTLFLCQLPQSYRGYSLIANNLGELFIGVPSLAGENKIYCYRDNQLIPFITTLNLLGEIALSPQNILYWVENTRKESLIYRMGGQNKKEKVMSGSFFKGIFFNNKGTLFVNDSHNIYEIKKEWLYE